MRIEPDDLITFGPFMGFGHDEAREFVERVEFRIRREHDPALIRNEAFIDLSKNRPLEDLIQRWIWVNSKFTGHTALRMDMPHAWAQLEVVRYIDKCWKDGRPCRIVILKARRLGMTTIFVCVFFLMASVMERMDSLIISDIDEHARKAKDMAVYALDHMVYGPRCKATKEGIKWPKPQYGNLDIESSEGRNPGRGLGYNMVLFDEVAHYVRDANKIVSDVIAAVPKSGFSLIAQNSTPKGAGGHFYRLYRRAKKEESEYKHFFFSWLRHPAYAIPLRDEDYPRFEKLSERETSLMEHHGMNLEQAKFRRFVVDTEYNGQEEIFDQEYPVDDISCFLRAGRPVFDPDTMLLVDQRVSKIEPVLQGDLVEI